MLNYQRVQYSYFLIKIASKMVESVQVKVFNGFHPDNANKIFPQAMCFFPNSWDFWTNREQNHTTAYQTKNIDESKIRNKDAY